MALNRNHTRSVLLGATALVSALMLGASPAAAQERQYEFDLPTQPLDSALRAFARQSQQQLIFADADTVGLKAPGLNGAYSAEDALQVLLAGTDLQVRRSSRGALIIAPASDPQGGSAANDGADVEALIVTAQKREEAIQDVPIAISAFSQKALEEQKIEGGFDLLKAIPNVTFSKSNFSSYNFSIRGVGTKAISATTDPGVAVAFNNTTLIQNRLFEQEYFDVERVEVLRGPQGTLYGRNATSGVINVITAKPDFDTFEGSIKLEGGNFDARRVVGMVNIPIIEDVLAIRAAGAMTQRTGYDFNLTTGNNINGRDLWSGRVTVGFEPNERIHADLLWEHFEEDDDRSRTGKQLCHRDPGRTEIDGVPVPLTHPKAPALGPALFSQGCKPGSLYDDAAFGTPNGLALPFVFAPLMLSQVAFFPFGYGPGGHFGFDTLGLLAYEDPYGGRMQSRDLREIESIIDPRYRAKADVIELSVDIDVTDSLTLSSQTAYNEDEVYSFQDFNRFNTDPVFTDTSAVTSWPAWGNYSALAPRPVGTPVGTAGVFCDPQLGCSDSIVGADISQAKGRQFSQELRLQSAFDGPVNFSVGANYTQFETLIDYYVFYNLITAYSLTNPFNRPINGVIDITRCGVGGLQNTPVDLPNGDPAGLCPYIDPNPIESINGDGHNYFRSKNPYDLKSRAVFGELYWEMTDALKLTAGLRYTDDTKTFTPVPSQVLLAPGFYLGGTVSRGYPEKPPIVQQWGEFTGRLGLDWKPELSFTDQTMVYAFYSRGYKGGGANPPTPGFATLEEQYIDFVLRNGGDPSFADLQLGFGSIPVLQLTATEYGRTFRPEYVNAFEVGSKNTLLDGAMTFNATAFYYDYRDYQVSQIRDRTAVNENFDAKIWGLEFETVFSPSRNLRINANLGYLNTRIADGATSIDIMNRTQGDPDYVVVKPWAQLPSNCVVPVSVVHAWFSARSAYYKLCGGIGGALDLIGTPIIDPATGEEYTPLTYPELNGGAGLRADLGGNDLPNSPHWTSNIGAQYGIDIPGGWRATVRGDVYWQSQSFARVYNTQYDKLRAWTNANLSVWVEQPDWGLKIEVYAKNVFDETPITDAFLNSDDTALTTNVFTLDPRLIGISVRKDF